MTKQIDLSPHIVTTFKIDLPLRPVCGMDLATVTKRIHGGSHNFGRAHPFASDQRVFFHIQTKNKHPHSTKKHK